MTQTACPTCGTDPGEQTARTCPTCGPDQSPPVPPPGRPQASSTAVRDPRRPALIAQVAIGLFALVDPLRAAAGVWSHSAAPGDDATRAAGAQALSTTLSLLAWTAAIVAFLRWFHRSRRNAEAFSPGTAAHAPGWAIGAWFTPVLMWWRPRRITLDISRASTAIDTDGIGRLVNAWWAAWTAHWAFALISVYWIDANGPIYASISQALNITAAVLAILVIHQVTVMQNTKVHSGPGAGFQFARQH